MNVLENDREEYQKDVKIYNNKKKNNIDNKIIKNVKSYEIEDKKEIENQQEENANLIILEKK